MPNVALFNHLILKIIKSFHQIYNNLHIIKSNNNKVCKSIFITQNFIHKTIKTTYFLSSNIPKLEVKLFRAAVHYLILLLKYI